VSRKTTAITEMTQASSRAPTANPDRVESEFGVTAFAPRSESSTDSLRHVEDGGSRTLKMSIWQLIDAAVFTGQHIERIPLPLPNRFLWCSPKLPENH
jgi:hypothetical protein